MYKYYPVLKFSLIIYLICFHNSGDCAPTNCNGGTGVPASIFVSRPFPDQLKNSKKGFVTAKNSLRYKQTQSGFTYQHDLPGEWDNVIGHVGYLYEFENVKNAFVSGIGLPTVRVDENTYETIPWDHKVFWIYMDGGAPQHFSGDCQGLFIDLETNNEIYIYSAYNILYQKAEKDYSESVYNGEWTYIELITDLENNVLEYYLYLLDENDEIVEESKLQTGDKIQSWTSILDLEDPSVIWLNTLEDDLRTITIEPKFTYEYLVPDIDFPVVKGVGFNEINFALLDLQIILWGYYQDPNIGNKRVEYSNPKDMKIKWGLTPNSSVVDWVLHYFKKL